MNFFDSLGVFSIIAVILSIAAVVAAFFFIVPQKKREKEDGKKNCFYVNVSDYTEEDFKILGILYFIGVLSGIIIDLIINLV